MTKQSTNTINQQLQQVVNPLEQRQQLNHEIENFDRSKLKKQMVYFVSANRFPIPFVPKFHSFIVIDEAPGKKDKTRPEHIGHGHVYFIGPSIMHSHYTVSDDILYRAQHSDKISAETKSALQTLANRYFPSVEHFLRALLLKKAKLAHQRASRVAIYRQAAFPDDELKTLVGFKELHIANRGAMLPLEETGRRLIDRKAFESGKSKNKLFPTIDPMVLRDLFREQQIRAMFLDERAGIGKATPMKIKLRINKQETDRVIRSMPKFDFFPHKNNGFSANCNKSCATILELAEKISAKQQSRKEKKIESASFANIAVNQRMLLWNPTSTDLNGVVGSLIDQEDLPAKMKLHSLAKKRVDIFHILCTLPTEEKRTALEQALDKHTALGKIFHSDGGVINFLKHPDEKVRYLDYIKDELAQLPAPPTAPLQNVRVR